MAKEEEFLTLFGLHEVQVKRFVRAAVRDPQDYEDICQTIALVLWKKFDQYDGERSFGAWARGIAAKEIQAHWARSPRRPLALPTDVIDALLISFDERLDNTNTARLEHLEECLKRQPAKSLDLIRLRYAQSLSLTEIAKQLGATVTGTHMRLSRVRARLRECMHQRLLRMGGVKHGWPT